MLFPRHKSTASIIQNYHVCYCPAFIDSSPVKESDVSPRVWKIILFIEGVLKGWNRDGRYSIACFVLKQGH